MVQKGSKSKAGELIKIGNYRKYEDYLDSMVSRRDIDYLGSDDVARLIAEMGFRCSGDIMTREQFNSFRKEEEEMFKRMRDALKLTSYQLTIADRFLNLLAEREKANRNGMMNTLIFIRALNKWGMEVSGYIDYKHRLTTDQFRDYFTGKERLMPKKNDLSYFNWRSEVCSWAASPNFLPVCTSTGVQFRHRFDHKIINVDPKASSPGEDTYRFELEDDKFYIQAIIFDHVSRKKC